MTTLKVDILNPKAIKLLNDLADLDLIAIKETSKTNLSVILKRLRSKTNTAPSLEEITKEVETVRSERYER